MSGPIKNEGIYVCVSDGWGCWCPVKVASSVTSVTSNSATLRTVAHQASLSMGFSRPGYWGGVPFPGKVRGCLFQRRN